ncbi:hypothetical protein BJX76DRAFT_316077 [Aspergillus varians]
MALMTLAIILSPSGIQGLRLLPDGGCRWDGAEWCTAHLCILQPWESPTVRSTCAWSRLGICASTCASASAVSLVFPGFRFAVCQGVSLLCRVASDLAEKCRCS